TSGNQARKRKRPQSGENPVTLIEFRIANSISITAFLSSSDRVEKFIGRLQRTSRAAKHLLALISFVFIGYFRTPKVGWTSPTLFSRDEGFVGLVRLSIWHVGETGSVTNFQEFY